MKFASVKIRVLLGIIIPLLIMAGGVTGIAVWKMRATAIEDFTAKSQQELSLFGLYVSEMITTGQNTARALAHNASVRNGLGKFPSFAGTTQDTRYRHEDLSPEARAVVGPLRNMQNAHSHLAEVFIGYRDGSYASSLLSMPAASFVATGTARGRHSVAAGTRGVSLPQRAFIGGKVRNTRRPRRQRHVACVQPSYFIY